MVDPAPVAVGYLHGMLTPEDAAELDRIRDAKEHAQLVFAWEARVVKRARAAGATQEEVALRLGVSREMVYKIERRDVGEQP